MPATRPVGLRLTAVTHRWYRIDAEPPAAWQWKPFPAPRYRFDSAAGAFRTRYAADTPRVAMRERFDEFDRLVGRADLDTLLVELTGRVQVLDLRLDRTLDALRLDDQINTGRARGVWAACHTLADLVHDWFGPRCDGIAYRSRTTPQHAANLAFFEHARLAARSIGPLRDQTGLLASCLLDDGFAIQGWR